MFIAQRDLNCRHPSMDLCQREEERKRLQLAAEQASEGSTGAPTAYGIHLATSPSFKYPVRILSTLDGNCQEVVHNLGKAWKRWLWLSRLMGREGVDAWMLLVFYV